MVALAEGLEHEGDEGGEGWGFEVAAGGGLEFLEFTQEGGA